jgi:hypothetical protein
MKILLPPALLALDYLTCETLNRKLKRYSIAFLPKYYGEQRPNDQSLTGHGPQLK